MLNQNAATTGVQRFPLFPLLSKRYPSVIFNEWLEDVSDHLDSIEAQLTGRPQAVRTRFGALKARFSLIRSEARKYTHALASTSSEKMRQQAGTRMTRLMWLVSEMHSEALELLDAKAA